MSSDVADDASNKAELSAVSTYGLNLTIDVLTLDQPGEVLHSLAAIKSVLRVADDSNPCLGIWSCLEQIEYGFYLCETNDCFDSKDVRLSAIYQDLESWSMVLCELLESKSFTIVFVWVYELFDSIGANAGSDQELP